MLNLIRKLLRITRKLKFYLYNRKKFLISKIVGLTLITSPIVFLFEWSYCYNNFKDWENILLLIFVLGIYFLPVLPVLGLVILGKRFQPEGNDKTWFL